MWRRKSRKTNAKWVREEVNDHFRGKIKFYEAVQVFYSAEDTPNDASKVID